MDDQSKPAKESEVETGSATPTKNDVAKSPKKRRWPWIVALLLLVLAVAGLIALRMAAASLITPENIVKELEKRYNARVEIGAVDVSLFGMPAKVRIDDVKISHRDQDANDGLPLAERGEALPSVMAFEFVELEASIGGLLSREISVKSMTFGPGKLIGRMRKTGEVTLSDLFEMPDIVNGRKNPRKYPEERQPADPERVKGGGGAGMTFTGLDSFELQDTDVSVEINGRKNRIDAKGLSLKIGKIAIGPKGNPNTQTIPVELAGELVVFDVQKDIQQAMFELEGKATVNVVAEGEDTEVKDVGLVLDFGPKSTISVLPTLERLREKVEKLGKAGIDIESRLADSVTFPAEGSRLEARLSDGRVTTTAPFNAVYGDFDVIVDPGGFVNIGSREHFFALTLPANEELSTMVRDQLAEKAQMIPTVNTRDKFLSDVRENLFANDRLQLLATSKGDMSKPDVDIVNEMPDAESYLRGMLDELGVGKGEQDQLEEAGKALLEGLLK